MFSSSVGYYKDRCTYKIIHWTKWSMDKYDSQVSQFSVSLFSYCILVSHFSVSLLSVSLSSVSLFPVSLLSGSRDVKPYSSIYCIFSECTMSSQRKFTFAISSPDEFLVCNPPESYRIRWNYDPDMAITPFKVIQGHRVWYQSKAHMRFPISDY